MAEGYITKIGLDAGNEIIGYEFVSLGRMMDMIKTGMDAGEALKKAQANMAVWKMQWKLLTHVKNRGDHDVRLF